MQVILSNIVPIIYEIRSWNKFRTVNVDLVVNYRHGVEVGYVADVLYDYVACFL
jgi:hypothetical protein